MPRLFAADAEIVHLGNALIACSLARSDWTHEAHLATCLYLLRERPEIDVDREIRGLISRFNVSVGGVNDATQGYHDTITHCFIAGVRLHLSTRADAEPLVDCVNALLAAPMGRRDWPLRFYSAALLFSPAARLGLVAPDLAPLPQGPRLG